MNIDYKKLFVGLIAALLLTVPVATALKNKDHQFNVEKSKSNQLQIDVKKRDSELQKKQDELKLKTDEAEKLKQQNEQLQKDLQAKRERQAEEARLAAARQNAAVAVGGNCEAYRPLVQKYFGDATPAAMITMQKESGCNPRAVSPTNDHGLFQLNQMPIYDPEANIKAAYAKFVSPRRGTKPNWSAWYAVCTPDLVPKYAGIWCA